MCCVSTPSVSLRTLDTVVVGTMGMGMTESCNDAGTPSTFPDDRVSGGSVAALRLPIADGGPCSDGRRDIEGLSVRDGPKKPESPAGDEVVVASSPSFDKAENDLAAVADRPVFTSLGGVLRVLKVVSRIWGGSAGSRESGCRLR